MDARHRIRIIAAVAVAALSGERAAAQEEPIPDTELGRAVRACVDDLDFIPPGSYYFYDNGLSVFVGDVRSEKCVLQGLGLPEWVGRPTFFVGVLNFGDWSLMRAALPVGDPVVDAFLPVVGAGDLLIMDIEVAPDN